MRNLREKRAEQLKACNSLTIARKMDESTAEELQWRFDVLFIDYVTQSNARRSSACILRAFKPQRKVTSFDESAQTNCALFACNRFWSNLATQWYHCHLRAAFLRAICAQCNLQIARNNIARNLRAIPVGIIDLNRIYSVARATNTVSRCYGVSDALDNSCLYQQAHIFLDRALTSLFRQHLVDLAHNIRQG